MDAWSLPPDDPRYPRALADLPTPPELRIRGTLPEGRAVSIVGTRSSTPEAERFTSALAEELSREGLVVWSGGALGIDAAAHRGALAAGAPTVVVLGSGVDQASPPQNLALFEEVVARGGALVSRLPDGVVAHTGHFHARNAVIAAASDVVVVVECPVKSGARSTVRHARLLRRKVAVVPHPPWSLAGAGCLEELVAGAAAVRGARDVLALLGQAPRSVVDTAPGAAQRALFAEPPRRRAEPPEHLGPLERRVWLTLTEPRHVDEVCRALGEPTHAIVAALVTMTLGGTLAEEPVGVFRRAGEMG